MAKLPIFYLFGVFDHRRQQGFNRWALCDHPVNSWKLRRDHLHYPIVGDPQLDHIDSRIEPFGDEGPDMLRDVLGVNLNDVLRLSPYKTKTPV